MAIEIDSLRKEFDVPSGTEVAVDGISLTIAEGEFVTLVGPSGCGKTTTLRCLAGLETPTSGVIRFHGQNVTDVPANRRNAAMMFQEIALYPHMPIIDNIAYPLKLRDVPKSERYQKAREAAETVDIGSLLDKHPGELSGGQRQRAALARTIVQDPIVFLLDEPLSDLDAKLKVDIRKEIQKIHKKLGKPTVYVTHDQEEALTMSDRIVVMNDGGIEQVGTPHEMYYSPQNVFVANFIGNPSMNFIDATATFQGDTVTIRVGELDVEAAIEPLDDPAHRSVEERDVIVGFRPEALELGGGVEQADFNVVVELIEQTGNQLVASLDTEFGELSAIIDMNTSLKEDEPTGAYIDRASIYLFDPDTEEIIAQGEGLHNEPGAVR